MHLQGGRELKRSGNFFPMHPSPQELMAAAPKQIIEVDYYSLGGVGG